MNKTNEFIKHAIKRVMFILTGNFEKSLAKEEFRRAQIVKLILICEIVEMFVFGVLDVTIYNLYMLGVTNFVFLIFCTVALWNYYKHQNLELASWLSVSIIALMLIVYIFIVRAKFNSLIWISLFPLVTFYVLGLRKGLIVYLIFCTIIISIISYGTFYWDDLNGTETLSNLIGASLFGGVFIYIYEFTRDAAIKQIEKKTTALQNALDEVQTLMKL